MVRMHKTHDKELLSSGQWHFGKESGKGCTVDSYSVMSVTPCSFAFAAHVVSAGEKSTVRTPYGRRSLRKTLFDGLRYRSGAFMHPDQCAFEHQGAAKMNF